MPAYFDHQKVLYHIQARTRPRQNSTRQFQAPYMLLHLIIPVQQNKATHKTYLMKNEAKKDWIIQNQ